MDTKDRIDRQRIQHIIDSYHLDGDDGELFADRLAQLLEMYPQSFIELALTEAIVKGWSEIPMPRGMEFIQPVHDRLRFWRPNLEALSQLSNPGQTHAYGSTSVGIVLDAEAKTLNPDAIETDVISTFLTPEQFEQITGLDPSWVFDQSGKVRLT